MTVQKVALGQVDPTTIMTIYWDGTFTFKKGFGRETEKEPLIAFEHDTDAMRRKSMTGRGAAAAMTGGLSLLASNNRGVLYVTVTGERSGVKTFTTRNPGNGVLSGVRTLEAGAQQVLAHVARQVAPPSSPRMQGGGVADEIAKLAELHRTGALSDSEFAAAKARLLG